MGKGVGERQQYHSNEIKCVVVAYKAHEQVVNYSSRNTGKQGAQTIKSSSISF